MHEPHGMHVLYGTHGPCQMHGQYKVHSPHGPHEGAQAIGSLGINSCPNLHPCSRPQPDNSLVPLQYVARLMSDAGASASAHLMLAVASLAAQPGQRVGKERWQCRL